MQPNENKEFNYVQEIITKKTQKVDKLLNDIEQRLDTMRLEQIMNNLDFISNDLLVPGKIYYH